MIDKITIVRLPDGKFAYARFETRNEQVGADFGCRVKHYIYKDEETRAYWHERVYLSRIAKPKKTYTVSIEKRKFWGKVRLVKYRSACLPETWAAVAQCVTFMEQNARKK